MCTSSAPPVHLQCAGKTGRMVVATHEGRESCIVAREGGEGGSEALTGVRAGRVASRERPRPERRYADIARRLGISHGHSPRARTETPCAGTGRTQPRRWRMAPQPVSGSPKTYVDDELSWEVGQARRRPRSDQPERLVASRFEREKERKREGYGRDVQDVHGSVRDSRAQKMGRVNKCFAGAAILGDQVVVAIGCTGCVAANRWECWDVSSRITATHEGASCETI